MFCAERKLYRLVAVSFGFLCVLQAGLNVSLRLYLSDLSQQGWVYFNNSFYYISTSKNSWNDSRSDCLQRGADLVVINSKAEQVCLCEYEFTRHFQQHIWIGLTDHEMEGKWKWVDGTPLTKRLPNNFGSRDEDCVEVGLYGTEMNWNDAPCRLKNFWMCEKMLVL
uniref:C-type lectin domain-containing protein n=1 Tax=Acanthochromis polyacanthus TaxID=80966 RepID=A0A3Q1EIC0_9TELE